MNTREKLEVQLNFVNTFKEAFADHLGHGPVRTPAGFSLRERVTFSAGFIRAYNEVTVTLDST